MSPIMLILHIVRYIRWNCKYKQILKLIIQQKTIRITTASPRICTIISKHFIKNNNVVGTFEMILTCAATRYKFSQ